MKCPGSTLGTLMKHIVIIVIVYVNHWNKLWIQKEVVFIIEKCYYQDSQWRIKDELSPSLLLLYHWQRRPKERTRYWRIATRDYIVWSDWSKQTSFTINDWVYKILRNQTQVRSAINIFQSKHVTKYRTLIGRRISTSLKIG